MIKKVFASQHYPSERILAVRRRHAHAVNFSINIEVDRPSQGYAVSELLTSLAKELRFDPKDLMPAKLGTFQFIDKSPPTVEEIEAYFSGKFMGFGQGADYAVLQKIMHVMGLDLELTNIRGLVGQIMAQRAGSTLSLTCYLRSIGFMGPALLMR